MRARSGTSEPLSSTPTLQHRCMAAHMVAQRHIFTMLPLCCWETPQQHGDVVLGWVLALLPSQSLVSVCEPEIYRADMIPAHTPFTQPLLHVYFQRGLFNLMCKYKMESQWNDRDEQKLLFPQTEWWGINMICAIHKKKPNNIWNKWRNENRDHLLVAPTFAGCWALGLTAFVRLPLLLWNRLRSQAVSDWIRGNVGQPVTLPHTGGTDIGQR